MRCALIRAPRSWPFVAGRGARFPRRRQLLRRSSNKPDDQDLLDWKEFFDSLDSDDLGLPGFVMDQKRKRMSHQLGNCYGCGVLLQRQHPSAPGYVDKETFEAKSRHKQRNSILCSRYGPCPC
jgi:hypothetical protein